MLSDRAAYQLVTQTSVVKSSSADAYPEEGVELQQLQSSQDGAHDKDDDDRFAGLQPLEIVANDDEYAEEVESSFSTSLPLFYLQDPWLPSLVTSIHAVPVLLGIMWCLFGLTGRMFICFPFALHLFVTMVSVRLHIHCGLFTTTRTVSSAGFRVATSIASLLDIVLLGFVYPKVWHIMVETFFTEPDGTTVIEWTHEKLALQIFTILGRVIAVLRLKFGILALVSRLSVRCCNDYLSPPDFSSSLSNPRGLATVLYHMRQGVGRDHQSCLKRSAPFLSRLANLPLFLSAFLLVWCAGSLATHLYSWPAPTMKNEEGCDAMDTTECWLPFPSFEFMKRDPSTATGWRVNLKGHVLPPLKGNIPMDPHFLNELDGFSTMGSILFYMEGLKEAHEAGVAQLQGPANIAQSVTPQSITLLLDVNSSTLVAHSAEIDYLDPMHPLVMVFPAQPLKHANHYALAVVNATDGVGIRLSPTLGLTNLLTLTTSDGSSDTATSDRTTRYMQVVIPALEVAAPWFSFSANPGNLQLIFDFMTASEEAQLGPVRAVRDATLTHIAAPAWGGWSQHVRVNKLVDNHQCSSSESQYYPIARTVHAEIDVPWFLEKYGRGHRGAVLSMNAVVTGTPVTLGAVTFVVHIPCSVRGAALGEDGSKKLRAIMEYGHGLFFSRQEASDHFLLQMAHDEGYVIVAMDWRGMSIYDLLIVAKTLLSKPRLFQAVRDNLIQGYANKFALQHFSQNGMLSMDWFRFESSPGDYSTVPTYNDNPPISVFYGISQGGILGAGYAALSGITGLIERAVLGVPGTPFALIMTRSIDFTGYDKLMLLNVYDNRQVRALLALIQMAWDSVEGSGVLAPPVREPIPRMLLQAGLGDAVVPTIAAEALARGLNASILPNNPRIIYNVPVSSAADEIQDGPFVTLTELLYEREYSSMPLDDTRAEKNSVHVCVRRDLVLIHQITEFINTGRIIDVCVNGGCRREHSC